MTRISNLFSKTIYTAIYYTLYGHTLKTLTSDNGSELAKLDLFIKNKKKGYTTHPYASHERHNGLIRLFISKGANISRYTKNEINEIQYKFNHKPRKCLGYKTPYEIYHSKQLFYIK